MIYHSIIMGNPNDNGQVLYVVPQKTGAPQRRENTSIPKKKILLETMFRMARR